MAEVKIQPVEMNPTLDSVLAQAHVLAESAAATALREMIPGDDSVYWDRLFGAAETMVMILLRYCKNERMYRMALEEIARSLRDL